jgi:ubiquinone/menaquinone biosynthesis C-methylase UbiE
MADAYPALTDAGTFYTGAIERLVPEFADGAFDVVYSVETLQHVHPDDDWVFEELVRVTGDMLVTIENEGADPDTDSTDETVQFVNRQFPLYHRNWNGVFTDRGLDQLFCHRSKPDTICAFGTLGTD